MTRASDVVAAAAVALGWWVLSWRAGAVDGAWGEVSHVLGVLCAGIGGAALVRVTGGVGQVGATGAAVAVALAVRGHPWAALLGVVAWGAARVWVGVDDPWRRAVRDGGGPRSLAPVAEIAGVLAFGVPSGWGAVAWLVGRSLGIVALGRLLARVCSRWPAAVRMAALVGLGAATLGGLAVSSR
jgi:hypothetical protein